jgi:hypothetical protein
MKGDSKHTSGAARRGVRQPKPGVWSRGRGRSGPANPIRVRTKRLDEIDADKIALAYWLLAKQIVEDESDQRPLSETEVRRVAAALDREPDDQAGGAAVDSGAGL